MDIVMPDMGGIDAVREITKFDPKARILMCSAMGQQALVIEAIQAGARDFVVKPFQPSRVLEAVQRVLAQAARGARHPPRRPVDKTQYAELFLTESREHVSAMNHWLLQLEQGAGGTEPISAIFRAVHTVKGMSATMGYSAVAELSHELETLLDRVRRGELAVTSEVMEVLFRSADALEASIEAAVRGQRPPLALSQLVLQIRSVAAPPAQGNPDAPAH